MVNVSVIIPLRNEEEKIAEIISEVKRINPFEIITVVNGSTDRTESITKSLGCKVIQYKESLGHNVGRAIGAYYAKGEILLFIDGDIVIKGELLQKMIDKLKEGYDITLNNLNWMLNIQAFQLDQVSLAKKALGDLCNHNESGINSLVAIPHALTRKALERIGWHQLANAPISQAIALKENLLIAAPFYIEVIKSNRIRPELHLTIEKNTPYTRSQSRIIGDHLEAINYMIKKDGIRGGYSEDSHRSLRDILPKTEIQNKRSVVIVVQQAPLNWSNAIEYLKSLGAEEIIFVCEERFPSKTVARHEHVKFITVPRKLGLFEGRVIGAAACTGDNLLFLDEMDVIEKINAEPFYKKIESGSDIALKNVSTVFRKSHPFDSINTIQYFLNVALKKPNLLNNSLFYTPFSVSRKALNKIGINNLINPPLAMAIAIKQQLGIQSLNSIVNSKRYNSYQKYEEIILGDFFTAFNQLFTDTDFRGGYAASGKNLSVVNELLNNN
ncbi:glycosyltransferase family 2 protein [Litchfieldia salsa]|uniref:Glycosyl transferase family 2 n=1 Tax=Litchfieldia salsa TaxID=930152 RepID=A0A1H0WYD5_9BACI|nr:glycosyltransferase family 2 protein [Litchfieldia salsa]SDP95630.1 Glycosyl transferase family 2 [Litchfieldia salsa]